MRGLLIAFVLLLGGVMLEGGSVAMAGPDAILPAAGTDLSSQSISPSRARTRIRVTPARRVVRQCDFHLVREVRASGTYIVPQQHCWWARL